MLADEIDREPPHRRHRPIGPPRGYRISRRAGMQPFPPLPARTWMSTSSTNMGKDPRRIFLFEGKDADHAAVRAMIGELHSPRDLREKGVILAPADVQSGLETTSALADENRTAGHEIAVVALDAKPLRITVAAVS